MTYVPVPKDQQKGHGRSPLEIPEALLAQLQHSRSTGAKCRIELTEDDDPAEVADLKRALVRAGYRHFPEHTIYKEFRPTHVTYWVGPKKPRGTRGNGEAS